MTRRVTLWDLPDAVRRAVVAKYPVKPHAVLKAGDAPQGLSNGQTRPSKYGAKATVVDGIRFASKLEAKRYSQLVALQKWGTVAFFLRQVPFDVAISVRYLADFLVVYTDGRLEVEDVKGILTPTSRTKIAVVEDRYRIKVKSLKREDLR